MSTATATKPKTVAKKVGAAGKAPAVKASAARFAAFIAKEPTTGELLIKRVRKGYPAELVKHAGMFFSIPEKRVLQIIGVAGSTAHRYQTQGKPLDPAASERVHRLAIVTREAIDVFGSAAPAKDWMLRPNHALGDTPPLDLLDTEIGANAVRRILVAIAQGGVV
ncbi:putative toxin-antitoxin system antitoxin component (TIGR02293 family) [Sulfuritortus calidifontis]|uniref:Putative toxin-antitoxin system antitoxin component (TIGR02293 family) n=1 Tax=Sulfuritortus calidifontis TaxID=1914471 RepID=A0A4R3JX75_9PROT|nr:antitoxin Xre/MbcA/ParS toxin-binding domain-containing protein [Sulfuritortus calidifontis]TCS72924.1 putative toxin-antitoxin system antitoxin component (TIGR02293 family) [Sulfuritortus calidifontis]